MHGRSQHVGRLKRRLRLLWLDLLALREKSLEVLDLLLDLLVLFLVSFHAVRCILDSLLALGDLLVERLEGDLEFWDVFCWRECRVDLGIVVSNALGEKASRFARLCTANSMVLAKRMTVLLEAMPGSDNRG